MNDLSLHILDIVQNSIRANASRIQFSIHESVAENVYRFEVHDNGDGMSKETVEKVCDPFFTTRTTRKVGLGLSLLKQNAQQAGGDIEISSELGKGTSLAVWFEHNNFDRPATGNIGNTLTLLICVNTEIEIEYKHKTDAGEFSISTSDIKMSVGDGMSINQPVVIKFIDEMIAGNLDEIKAENSR